MALKADAVFEGGGVKGIGLVGAVSEVEKAGYQFENLAGTSAGAIVACLLAVGFTAKEIKSELEQLDYNDFKDEGLLDKLGVVGKALSVGFEYGIYEGEYFENWLEGLLQRKQKLVFGDLDTGDKDARFKYKLQVVATDVTNRRLLVLPGDIASYGMDPDKLSISRAVRMSMSIPLFFEPVRLADSSGRVHVIVDGGVLSNYPIWLLDDGSTNPAWPTFGFKLTEPDKRVPKDQGRSPINNPLVYLKALIGTMMDAHDSYHISRTQGDFARTIGIPTVVKVNGFERAVRTTDFDITRKESEALYQNGVAAGKAFLSKWDFEAWKKEYRKPAEAAKAATAGSEK